MGSSQSTSGGGKFESTAEIIAKINNYSQNYGSKDPNDASVQGMNRYLNEKEGLARDQRVGSSPIERSSRYASIEALSSSIGMDGEARFKLLTNAYNSLNTQQRYLEQAHIEKPTRETATHTVSSSRTEEGPKHPESTRQAAIALAVDPHSYCSLSGMTTKDLLALDTKVLDTIVKADQAFVSSTSGYWTLPESRRESTGEHLKQNYTRELAVEIGLAGQSNATPQDAFMSGKSAALNAVSLGYDIYQGGRNTDALKAFGEVAMSVNLAKDPSHTLAGRGADTISERTMSFSPDGHSLGGYTPKH